MNMIVALLVTQDDPRMLARPISWTRDGYYIADGAVWFHSPLQLSADFKTPRRILAHFPTADLLRGEWVVVQR